MKKSLFFLFILLSLPSFAQNTEAAYLQQERSRLTRAAGHEAAIQNYINQNIGTYTLPAAEITKIGVQKHEDGTNVTPAEINSAILNSKIQALRKQYFNQNPSIVGDYTASPIPAGVPCVNNGFENGDTYGFTFHSQRFDGNNGNPVWSIFNNSPSTGTGTLASANGMISLVEPGNDPNVLNTPGLPRVKSGNYALRLNNGVDGSNDVSLMRREIIVGSNQDYITFNYALVLQDPQDEHNGVLENPYYQCILKKGNDTIFKREIIANRFNTDVFRLVGDGKIVYTDWSCENIDVSQYKGETLTLELIIGDCGRGGHWGYGYFDDFCGTNCAAPTFGKVTLDPMAITCPLLPLTVSGNFITPAGYELENLTLRAKKQNTIVYTSSAGQYYLFGNEFNFTVTGQQLFPNGPASSQFDFFVTASFKLIGSAVPSFEVVSQSANVGPDVTFISGTCQICNSCAPISFAKNLLKGNVICGPDKLRMVSIAAIVLYSFYNETELVDGEILYTDSAMTIPYTGTSYQKFLQSNDRLYQLDSNGIISFIGLHGSSCTSFP